MSVTSDIKASYRGPGRVVARLLGQGRREGFALNILLFACIVIFVANAPYQSRQAHLTPDEAPLMARLYWSAMLWIFILPLFLYAFTALITGLARLAGRPLSGYGIRMATFWALLAVSPMTLLLGLMTAFIGSGPGVQLIGFLWLINILWFWISGLRAAEGAGK